MSSTPILVGTDSTGKLNVVSWNGLFYTVPKALGPIDLTTFMHATRPEGIAAYDSLQRAVNPSLVNPAQLGHTVSRMTQTMKDLKGV